MAKDIKLDGEQHDKLLGYLAAAFDAGAVHLVNVRRKADNAIVPVIGVTHMTPEGIIFNPIAEVNDPDAEDLYFEPTAEDNLPPAPPATHPVSLILPANHPAPVGGN